MTTAIIIVLAIVAGLAAVQIRWARIRRRRRAEDELRRILAQLEADFAELQLDIGTGLLPAFQAMIDKIRAFGEALQASVTDPEDHR